MSSQSRNVESLRKRNVLYLKRSSNLITTMAGVPLSFAIKRTTKSVAKTTNSTETDIKKVFISEFSRDSEEAINDEKYVIPKQENRFGIKASFTPSFLPKGTTRNKTVTSEDRFEAAAVSEEPTGVKYGLHERHTSSSLVFTTTEKDETEAFRSELETLPDEANSQAYQQMPVDVFGLAMLRGMGWKEGQVLGKNKNKTPVEAMEFIPRASRLGLGAAPDSQNKKNNNKKKKRDPVMVLPVQSDNKIRHVRTLDEKLVPYEATSRIKEGMKMRIQSGVHEGFTCIILGFPSTTTVEVKLPNEEIIQVPIEDLSEDGVSRSKRRKTESAEGNGIVETNESWLVPHIRIRVTDKTLAKGAYYLKKGTVVDIVSPNVANIIMDSSQNLLEGIRSASVETIVPKKLGSKVMILTGQFKGQKGKLIEHTNDHKTVQLVSDLSIHKYTSRQISEYKES
eukprot:g2141.t1